MKSLNGHSIAMGNMTKSLDFAIVGGGILGTAVAALASAAGYGVLVLRLSDDGIPRADTLRNQGWLQSGIMYRIDEFADETGYKLFATRTFYAGREMLRTCGIPLPAGNGIVGVKKMQRIDELRMKSKLLRFSKDEFRQLEADEVTRLVSDLADVDTSYFLIPDVPFDEASVLTYLREEAKQHGAEFVQVTKPVTLERHKDLVRICFDGDTLESSLTLVTAGSGSFDLIGQVGSNLEGELRRTPLLVSHRPARLPSSVFVDIERGYSAVHHTCVGLPDGAVVIGTKAKLHPAPRVIPDCRRIPPDEQMKFAQCLHPTLASTLLPGRYTAGYEVIPNRSKGLTAYEPWIEDFGNVLFASPGRATVALMTAQETLKRLIAKISAASPRRFDFGAVARSNWVGPITMHFTPDYSFDDAEPVK